MTDTTDRLYETVLVLRCQAGDEAAFAELVERYQPRLRYFLRKMLRDVQGAEDALQDVWLDVFRAVSRLADVGASVPGSTGSRGPGLARTPQTPPAAPASGRG